MLTTCSLWMRGHFPWPLFPLYELAMMVFSSPCKETVLLKSRGFPYKAKFFLYVQYLQCTVFRFNSRFVSPPQLLSKSNTKVVCMTYIEHAQLLPWRRPLKLPNGKLSRPTAICGLLQKLRNVLPRKFRFCSPKTANKFSWRSSIRIGGACLKGRWYRSLLHTRLQCQHVKVLAFNTVGTS